MGSCQRDRVFHMGDDPVRTGIVARALGIDMPTPFCCAPNGPKAVNGEPRHNRTFIERLCFALRLNCGLPALGVRCVWPLLVMGRHPKTFTRAHLNHPDSQKLELSVV